MEEDQKAYSDSISQLEKVKYDKDEVREFLKKDYRNTLSAIIWATETGKINIKREEGKTIWRNILEYSHTNSMQDQVVEIEEKLYDIYSPERKEFSEIHADAFGLFLTGLTIGIINWEKVAKKRKLRKNHRLVMRTIS